ncbi:hypothetical protein [Anditalea andensis]|uniref:Uncharacterized protein n=1 Tax=Anditalea andensis TaxID=1048983 RepID=A0A074KWN1_9BACT|nr:hypothetical protein [Anditalea andensis]KEO73364.1 hypothetical protein EL17_13555 [Anditalea andensis]
MKQIYNIYPLLLLLVLGACVEEELLTLGSPLLRNSNMSLYPNSALPWKANNTEGMGVSKEFL